MLDSEFSYECLQGQWIGSAGIAHFYQEKLESVDLSRLKDQEY